jgi:putative hydrolase of the HAD superfamily
MRTRAAIEGAIFDLDGTLTDFNWKGVTSAFKTACVEAVLSLGAPFTRAEADQLAQQAFDESRSYGKYFAMHLNEHAFHYAYGVALASATTLIPPVPQLAEWFERVGFNNHVLSTHAARTWAEPVIKRLALDDWFPRERILALEDCNFERKHKSHIPFELCLRKLHTNAMNTVAVDDTIDNLAIPHEMGMRAVFINRGESLLSHPSFVEHEVRTPIEALQVIARINT